MTLRRVVCTVTRMTSAGGQVWTVEVGLALSRPPRLDRTAVVRVAAATAGEAELTAIAMASGRPGVVMAVSAVITDWPDD